jgi:tRNA threonylcarbamoyl adenosine modification protein YjeE
MAFEPAQKPPSGSTWYVDIADEAATVSLAADIASLVKAGDLVTLSGELGSGKTTFARALIRALVGDPDLEVPSPTFTLIQVYESHARDTSLFPIVHADLFRIKDPSELAELGWEEAAEGALVIVEWPERAGGGLAGDRLDVAFHTDTEKSDGFRSVAVTGIGSFGRRLVLSRTTRDILERSGFGDARRTFMMGDASTRAYERLTKPDGTKAILMISPPRPDGPPIRYGKPYSAIARLAEDIRPFIAIDGGLRGLGFSAPEIFAHDTGTGLAIIEDLGAELFVDANGIMIERYTEAVAALAHLHASNLETTLPDGDGGTYEIPPYDIEALSIEVELLPEWYAPHIAKVMPSSGAKTGFLALWRAAFADVLAAPPTWTLRDYHSPNLLWLADREGLARVGMIDFQDCVLGHPAYDVASLLQDARVTVPADVELRLLGHYALARKRRDPSFDMAAFAKAYAILGAQRATKILGIFARLDKRDRKPQYLVHIPRIQTYLRKNLAHPALAELKSWVEQNVPSIFATEP